MSTKIVSAALLMLASAVDGQVCLRIVTGTVWMLPGDLEVQVDQGTGGGSLVVATGNYAPGSTVLDACYPDVVGVTTRGLSNDGWVGSVFFSTDGGATYHPGHCSDCTVGSDTSSLVVDGNLDPREPRTHCSNGVLCHIQSGLNVFVEMAGPPNSGKYWKDVASSADGSILVAASTDGDLPGTLWRSTDSGARWFAVTRAGMRQMWSAVASSADGAKLVASVSNGNIWTSANSGATWSEVAGTTSSWTRLASSADGTKLAASVNAGPLRKSEDSGATWSEVTITGASNEKWYGNAMSADGTKMVVAGHPGNIWTSADSGATWSEVSTVTGPPAPMNFYRAASSADGMKLVVVARDGYIWTSADFGATWSSDGSPGDGATKLWVAVASSDDGSKLIAGAQGDQSLWTSANSGATWSEITGVPSMFSVTSTADGSRSVAATWGGGIWTGFPAHITPAPTTSAPTTSAPTTLAPTTSTPTTSTPTTSAPGTSAPTTSAPTTSAPTTSAPTPANGDTLNSSDELLTVTTTVASNTAAFGTDDDDDSNGIAVAGAVLGALGLLLAILAILVAVRQQTDVKRLEDQIDAISPAHVRHQSNIAADVGQPYSDAPVYATSPRYSGPEKVFKVNPNGQSIRLVQPHVRRESQM